MVIQSVAVCIPTRRRPQKLQAALDSVATQRWTNLVVVVADNAPDGSVETICAGHVTRPVYVVEERPGVVHVRNLLLTTADRLDVDAIVFLDDDQRFADGALSALVATADTYPGDLVAGSVSYEWEAAADGRVPDGPLPLEPAVYAEGEVIPDTGTGNTLIPVEAWRRAGRPLFDPAFGRSGGEDTEFFHRIAGAGPRLRWCANSVVVERLPESRATPEDLARRYVRAGHINGVLALRTHSRARVLAESMARVVIGAALRPWARLGRHVVPNPRATMYSGVGRMRAVFRRPPHHYGGQQ